MRGFLAAAVDVAAPAGACGAKFIRLSATDFLMQLELDRQHDPY